MSRLEKCVPGCSHESRGQCVVTGKIPTLAKEANVVPLGELEGPGLETAKGLVCIAAMNPNKQETCSDFVQRTEDDEERDGWI